MKEVLKSASESMDHAIAHLSTEFSSMRTGRANVHLLDSVKVNYYGTETPLNQLATVSAPDPTLLTIAPFDPSVIEEIEKAIHRTNLGLTPSSDGRLVRLSIPALTEERRTEMAKMLGKMGEESKTSIRHARREANEKFKAAEKNKDLSEDLMHDHIGEVQELTDEYIKKVDTMVEAKKTEIMQV